MTKHEFIFSDKRVHRIARHVTFWFIWVLAYNLLFHFPNHVYKGWDTSLPGTKNLQQLGLVLFFIKTFFVNSLAGVIIPQIAFVYVLLYWLLPKYYFKKRNRIITVALTLAVIVSFFFLAVIFKNSSTVYNHIVNDGPLYPVFDSVTMRAAIIDQLTSLPIIAGLALMIRLIKRWWDKHKENELLAREKINAELRLLKAQVHPHFLFNTLNNIYFFTLTGSPKAPEMIKKLSDLLHYILTECAQPLVPLEKEIKMIQDYVELEGIRYGDQINMTVELPGHYANKMISPLLLIPFVENAFKHGTSKMLTLPYLKLVIQIIPDTLVMTIVNSRPPDHEIHGPRGNIGLKNVKKRLELLYPHQHELNIAAKPGIFSVTLKVHLHSLTDTEINEAIPTPRYAIA